MNQEQQQQQQSPGPAYQFERSPARYHQHHDDSENRFSSDSPSFKSLDYSSNNDAESETYTAIGGGASSLTGLVPSYHPSFQDATDTVREMHLALLYLLSNPEEFQRALQQSPAQNATTLAEWNAEYCESESMTDVGSMITTPEESVATMNNNSHNNSNNNNNANNTAPDAQSGPTPLPFVVFADDAEVVLPQAHTASQLFGLERIEGIELEAAAGIPSLSQLFLRWLALMPGGDHLNLIDPPGLTVMRIAGGRYRVTAAHRVVWTWNNEFAALAEAHCTDEVGNLQAGDLVTMTIVDVFETDNQGKLLSYCPTFDNRAVHKTNPAMENLRKTSSKFMTILGKMRDSKAAKGFMSKAKSGAKYVNHKLHEAAANYSASPQRRQPPHSDVGSSVAEFEDALNAAESAVLSKSSPTQVKASASAGSSEGTLQDTDSSGKEIGRKDTRGQISELYTDEGDPVEAREAPNARSDAYISDSGDDATQENEI